MKKGINKLLLMMSFSVFPIALIGCDSFNSPVSYKFHYYVNGDNGKLISDYKHEPNECRAYCRYGCPDNAYNFDKYGK